MFPSEQILDGEQAANPSPKNHHKEINENSHQCCDELLEDGLHSTTESLDLLLQPLLTISVHRRELKAHAYRRSLVRTVASVDTRSKPMVKLSSTTVPMGSGVNISR
jgi:hypothetical protein